jgi:hypothetical protein
MDGPTPGRQAQFLQHNTLRLRHPMGMVSFAERSCGMLAARTCEGAYLFSEVCAYFLFF